MFRPPLQSPPRLVEQLGLPVATGATSLVKGLVRLSRPRQWLKNTLVFVAPAAGGVLLHWNILWHASAAFGIFCLAASGTYFLNDALDVKADRLHPTKRFRPVASGVVPVTLALSYLPQCCRPP